MSLKQYLHEIVHEIVNALVYVVYALFYALLYASVYAFVYVLVYAPTAHLAQWPAVQNFNRKIGLPKLRKRQFNKKSQMCIYDLYRSPCQRKILQGNCLLNSVQFACFTFFKYGIYLPSIFHDFPGHFSFSIYCNKSSHQS